MWYIHVYGLNSLVHYFSVKTFDTWEGNVTTRREIWTKNIHSLVFLDTREGVTSKEGDIMEVGMHMWHNGDN